MNKIVKYKLFRITTVPMSLQLLLKGQLNFISQYFNIIAVSSSGSDLDLIKKQGINTKVIQMTRAITPLKDIIAILKMYFVFRKEKPFIVHTHTPKAGLIGIVAAALARVPNRLHTVAGLPLIESSGLKRITLELVEKITYKFAHKVYPNSFGLRDFILQNNLCHKSKLKVIGNGSSNGIDTEYFKRNDFIERKALEFRKENNIVNEEIVFSFIGRIVKDKGVNELLNVFNQISMFKKVKLILVGTEERDLDPISNASLKILIHNKNIIKCGWQDDVRPFIAASDLLVFPSYREGLPNVLLQAGAMNLPSIVTDVNGCNEIIKHGENGLIVAPKNKYELKKAMLQLCDNIELRSYLAGNARKMVTSRYEQKFVWAELLKEYKMLEEQIENKKIIN